MIEQKTLLSCLCSIKAICAGGGAMNNSKISHRQLQAVVKVSFGISLFLIFLYVYDLISPRLGTFLKYTPPEKVNAVADTSVGVMADKVFLLIIPLAALLLMYIAVLLTALVRNMKNTTVCARGDNNCAFKKGYFS